MLVVASFTFLCLIFVEPLKNSTVYFALYRIGAYGRFIFGAYRSDQIVVGIIEALVFYKQGFVFLVINRRCNAVLYLLPFGGIVVAFVSCDKCLAYITWDDGL